MGKRVKKLDALDWTFIIVIPCFVAIILISWNHAIIPFLAGLIGLAFFIFLAYTIYLPSSKISSKFNDMLVGSHSDFTSVMDVISKAQAIEIREKDNDTFLVSLMLDGEVIHTPKDKLLEDIKREYFDDIGAPFNPKKGWKLVIQLVNSRQKEIVEQYGKIPEIPKERVLR